MASHRKGPKRDWRYPPQRVLEQEPCPECGKIAFASRGDAKSQIKLMEHDRHRHNAPDSRLHLYECPHGNGWHVAHRRSQGIRIGHVPAVA